MSYPTKKLEEVCDIFADGDWIETKDQSLSGIRLIQTGNVGEGFFVDKEGKRSRFITDSTFRRLNCTEIFPGDLLISRLPDPVGRSCVVPDINMRMITAVDCTIVRANEKKVLQKFLLFVTNSSGYHAQIRGNLSGTTRQRISRGSLGKIKIPLPPLAIQKQIVERLDKIAEAQKLNDELIQKTDELFQSLLHKELIPAGTDWEIKKLGSVFDRITDAILPTKHPEEKFNFIGLENIESNTSRLINISPVAGRFIKSTKTRFKIGDVLYGKLRPYLNKVWLADFDGICSTDIWVLRAKEEIILPQLLGAILQQSSIVQKSSASMAGANLPRANKDIFDKIAIALPPINTQKQIVSKLSAVQDYKKQLLEQKTKLKELFDSSLSKSMASEKKSKDA